MTQIAFVDELSEALEEKIQHELVTYEASHGIDVNYKPFALVLMDDKKQAIGALNAYTAFSEIYIDDICVESAQRGKGYGRKLIQALEDHFKGKGFNNINLVTSEFQCPEFYKKCGFTLEFVRKNNKNPKLNKYFFVKFFEDEVQNQGLVSE